MEEGEAEEGEDASSAGREEARAGRVALLLKGTASVARPDAAHQQASRPHTLRYETPKPACSSLTVHDRRVVRLGGSRHAGRMRSSLHAVGDAAHACAVGSSGLHACAAAVGARGSPHNHGVE